MVVQIFVQAVVVNYLLDKCFFPENRSGHKEGIVMHTVIKGTKTIAEYKQVQEDMQEKARAYFDAHKAGCEEWTHGLPEKIWREGDVLCIEYADGNWWHYKASEKGLEWW